MNVLRYRLHTYIYIQTLIYWAVFPRARAHTHTHTRARTHACTHALTHSRTRARARAHPPRPPPTHWYTHTQASPPPTHTHTNTALHLPTYSSALFFRGHCYLLRYLLAAVLAVRTLSSLYLAPGFLRPDGWVRSGSDACMACPGLDERRTTLILTHLYLAHHG